MPTIEELEAAGRVFENALRRINQLDNAENKTLAALHITNRELFYVRNTIRAALQQAIEIKRGNKVVVPREPTKTMYSAGSAWYRNHGAISSHIPTGCYTAMITAAQETVDVSTARGSVHGSNGRVSISCAGSPVQSDLVDAALKAICKIAHENGLTVVWDKNVTAADEAADDQ